MKELQAYKCDFCPKLYQREGFAKSHELNCSKNPENKRRCEGCVNLEKKEFDYFYDTWNGEAKRSVDVLHCKAKNVCVYSAIVERKGNWFEVLYDENGEEITNEPMPKECILFQTFSNVMDLMTD